METVVSDLTFYLMLVLGTIFLIGIIRPEFVVFWSGVKNRQKVAAVYGLLTVICFVVWSIASSRKEDTIKSDPTPRSSALYNPAGQKS